MQKEKIIQTVRYAELPEKLQEKVFTTLHEWLQEVYGIVAKKEGLKSILYEISPWVEYYIDKDGNKRFRIDDSDEKLGRYLGANFAISAKTNPELMDRIVMNMIKRNEDNPKLKVQ